MAKRYPLRRCETCNARDICACRGPAQLSCYVVEQLTDSFGHDGIDTPEEVGTPVPSRARVLEALTCFTDVLFPGRMATELELDGSMEGFVQERLARGYRLIRREIERALPFRWTGAYARSKGDTAGDTDVEETAALLTNRFVAGIPEVRRLLIDDVQAAYYGDPAAHTYAEIMLSYPGLQAITVHRIAHILYELDVPLIPRIMSEHAHTTTGIDINPGARIGHSFFIDHGTGVVIGETCEIGDNVKLYQGVTLGAKSFPLDEDGNPIKEIKRHPTLEDDVIVYAGATILGGETVIGRGAVIGSNVWLLESVPPGSTVLQGDVEVKVKRNEDSS
ncbi:MAG: serine O-acetyltransferase EpsC [Armatimonadota bacterium]|nr:serine O-acetyltransferase EpsC [Armatimonadota bacterium]